MKVYLSVPYKEKDDAKKLGAKWDPSVKKWYAPNSESSLLDRWYINTDPLFSICGENKQFCDTSLYIDLQPITTKSSHINHYLHPSEHQRFQKYLFDRVNNSCEFCNSSILYTYVGKWSYNIISKIKKLERLFSVCHPCWSVIEFIPTSIDSIDPTSPIITHLMKLRLFDLSMLSNYISSELELFNSRNNITWTIDISILQNSNLKLISPIYSPSPSLSSYPSLTHISNNIPLYINNISNNNSIDTCSDKLNKNIQINNNSKSLIQKQLSMINTDMKYPEELNENIPTQNNSKLLIQKQLSMITNNNSYSNDINKNSLIQKQLSFINTNISYPEDLNENIPTQNHLKLLIQKQLSIINKSSLNN